MIRIKKRSITEEEHLGQKYVNCYLGWITYVARLVCNTRTRNQSL